MISLNKLHNNQKTVAFGTNIQISEPIIRDMKLLPGETREEVDKHAIAARQLVLLQESVKLNGNEDCLEYRDISGTRIMTLGDKEGNKVRIEDPLKEGKTPKNTPDYVSSVRNALLSGYGELRKKLDVLQAEKAETKRQEEEQKRIETEKLAKLAEETAKTNEKISWVNGLLERLSNREASNTTNTVDA